jgi:hypothetical protein
MTFFAKKAGGKRYQSLTNVLLDIEGTVVEATDGGPIGPGGNTIAVQDDGAPVNPAATTLNFTGTGVTATNGAPGVVNVAIPGTSLDVQDDGSSIVAAADTLNFTGGGVVVTPGVPGVANVAVAAAPVQNGLNLGTNPPNGEVFSSLNAGNLEFRAIAPGPGIALVQTPSLIILRSALVLTAIRSTAGVQAVPLMQRQLYDASALAPLALTLQFPAGPQPDDMVAVKEVGNSFVPVVVNGNGANVEGVFTPSAPSFNLGLPRVALTWQYDSLGNIWRIV